MPMANADRARGGRQGRDVRAPADQHAWRVGAPAPGRRRRLLHRVPSDLERAAGHARELQRRVRDQADARRAARARSSDRSSVDAGRTTIMRSVSGFVQEEAPHIKQSELCATCHTLITQAFGPNGEVIGSLPEQMNYQEWQHSDFNTRAAKLPVVPHAGGRRANTRGVGARRCARHAGPPRLRRRQRLHGPVAESLSQRAWRRGPPVASSKRRRSATVRQLQHDTATLTLSNPTRAAGTLAFDVDIRNLTGHKLPTGYPSRRLWLHATVKNERGEAVFESGAFSRHRLRSLATTTTQTRCDSSRTTKRSRRPIRCRSTSRSSATSAARPTTGLLTATQYLKDNRLLPRGFDKATAAAEIGVYGGAKTDADFAGGGDRVRYRINVPVERTVDDRRGAAIPVDRVSLGAESRAL